MILITGGAAGIGAACAERCEADGFEAVVIDRVGSGLIADLSDTEATASPVSALAITPATTPRSCSTPTATTSKSSTTTASTARR